MNDRVLVLMATHNGIKWVVEQLQSILTQEGVEVSILVSDDASTDGTFEYLNASPNMTLLSARGPYGTAGKNFCNLLLRADFSGYNFVAFADQDDIWYPGKLKRAIDCMTTHGCDGYSANVTAFWEDGQEVLVDKAQPQREWDFLFQGAGAGCTYVMSVLLGNKISDFLRLNPQIPEQICLHDWFVYAWARANGFSWFIDKEPVMRYRQHSANDFGVNSGFRTAKNRLEQVKSGWYRGQVVAIAKACNVDSNPFIQAVLRHTWSGRISLALQARKFRRSNRDAIVLAVSSIMGWF